MAKDGKSTSGSTTSGNTGATESKSVKVRSPRGPSLNWTEDRDVALVEAIRDNPAATGDDLVSILQAHPAFSGAETLITRNKVANRATTLRAANVALPRLGGSGYNPERIADKLNALLGAGAGSGVGAGGDGGDIDEGFDEEDVESAIA